MCANKDLPSSCSLYVGEQPRYVANHGRMQRQLGLLQEQGPPTIENCPQETQQTQRAIGELSFVLSRTMLSPMLISSDEMSGAAGIALKLKLLQLWHSNLQRLFDAPQTSAPSSLWDASELLKEISTERIVSVTNRAVWLTH